MEDGSEVGRRVCVEVDAPVVKLWVESSTLMKKRGVDKNEGAFTHRSHGNYSLVNR